VSAVFQPSAHSHEALQNGGDRQALAAALAQKQQDEQAALEDYDAEETDGKDADGEVKAHISPAGIAVVLAFVGVPILVVGPWVVGKFKPEWGYGKRVAAGIIAGAVGGFVTRTTGLVKVEKRYVPVDT
jgi:hypothetical protein